MRILLISLLLMGCTNIANLGDGQVIYNPEVRTGGTHDERKREE